MDDDWRLMGQERFLQDAVFARKPYERASETWDHDHCEFCQRKFVEANRHSDGDGSATAGYAARGLGPEGQDDYYWVCDDCFADFRERFRWTASTS